MTSGKPDPLALGFSLMQAVIIWKESYFKMFTCFCMFQTSLAIFNPWRGRDFLDSTVLASKYFDANNVDDMKATSLKKLTRSNVQKCHRFVELLLVKVK